jgi:hypothetical protein
MARSNAWLLLYLFSLPSMAGDGDHMDFDWACCCSCEVSNEERGPGEEGDDDEGDDEDDDGG